MDSWKWIFYRPNKTFSEFPGFFEIEDFGNLQFLYEDFGGIKAEDKCTLGDAAVKQMGVACQVIADDAALPAMPPRGHQEGNR